MNIQLEHDVFVRQPIEYDLLDESNAADSECRKKMLPSAKKDYACFAIWEGGRSREDDIVAELKKSFTIVADFLIYWSDRHYRRNIQRLYLRLREGSGAGYDEKIGKPPFRFVIVEDNHPSYTWMKSVSGYIEPSNQNVVREKYRFRSWFDKPYQVHSSNNISEFYFQSVLLLGRPLLKQSLCTRSPEMLEVHRDLEGADGWKDWSELLSVLNVTANYLVLRNYDDLPNKSSQGDIDFLCEDSQWLASAANVQQNINRSYKGHVDVGGEKIPVDIRFVGDGYYSAAWEKDVLRRKAFHDGMYIPRADDYFFTLLYHCKVHKRLVSEKYHMILHQLAESMNFDWFKNVDISDDNEVGKILKGYMLSNNYYYERPVDRGVHENKNVAKHISTSPYVNRNVPPLIQMIKKRIKKIIKPFLMDRHA